MPNPDFFKDISPEQQDRMLKGRNPYEMLNGEEQRREYGSDVCPISRTTYWRGRRAGIFPPGVPMPGGPRSPLHVCLAVKWRLLRQSDPEKTLEAAKRDSAFEPTE